MASPPSKPKPISSRASSAPRRLTFTPMPPPDRRDRPPEPSAIINASLVQTSPLPPPSESSEIPAPFAPSEIDFEAETKLASTISLRPNDAKRMAEMGRLRSKTVSSPSSGPSAPISLSAALSVSKIEPPPTPPGASSPKPSDSPLLPLSPLTSISEPSASRAPVPSASSDRFASMQAPSTATPSPSLPPLSSIVRPAPPLPPRTPPPTASLPSKPPTTMKFAIPSSLAFKSAEAPSLGGAPPVYTHRSSQPSASDQLSSFLSSPPPTARPLPSAVIHAMPSAPLPTAKSANSLISKPATTHSPPTPFSAPTLSNKPSTDALSSNPSQPMIPLSVILIILGVLLVVALVAWSLSSHS